MSPEPVSVRVGRYSAKCSVHFPTITDHLPQDINHHSYHYCKQHLYHDAIAQHSYSRGEYCVHGCFRSVYHVIVSHQDRVGVKGSQCHVRSIVGLA